MDDKAAPEGQGFEYLEDVRRGETDEPIQAFVSMNSSQVSVHVSGAPGSEVLVGTGVGESVLDRVPVLAVTRRGQSALFAAAVEFKAKGQEEDVEGVEIEGEADIGYLIRVRLRNKGEELYAFDPNGGRRTVAGVQTESKLLCLRSENGQPLRVLSETKD